MLAASILDVLLALNQVGERRVDYVSHRRVVVRTVGHDLARLLEESLALARELTELEKEMIPEESAPEETDWANEWPPVSDE